MIAYLEKRDKIRKEETEWKLQAIAERETKRLAKIQAKVKEFKKKAHKDQAPHSSK